MKEEKVNALVQLLGDGIVSHTEMQVAMVYQLRTLAGNVVMRRSSITTKTPTKAKLNQVCAKALYPHLKKEWESNGTTKPNTRLFGEEEQEIIIPHWFSQPEYSEERGCLEPKCLDSHHLLVNLRSKVCKDGIHGFGIQKEAWHLVAEHYPDVISKSIVCDILDKQSNAFAQRTFSSEVENHMDLIGFPEEARLCRLVREWYGAQDEPGLQAWERVERRLRLREYLLSKVELDKFPPHGTHVGGMSRQMYEGFLHNIDSNLQLYSIVKGGSYNARAISSLANETFFGEMSEHEQTHLGCPKAIHCPRLISNVTEIMHYRHNPADR